MNLPGFILASFAALTLSLTLPAQANQPRLVLQITVDGLRADLLTRYAENFGKEGFYRLFLNALDCLRLAIVLPKYADEPQLIGIPLACGRRMIILQDARL